MHFFKIVINL